MYRRIRVPGLVPLAPRRALLIVAAVVGLAACVAGCGGAGETYCSPDDTTCTDAAPVDTPTDSPTDEPAPPPECVGATDVDLLFPVDSSSLSSYANTVYISFTYGADFTWSYAVDLVTTSPGQGQANAIEYGTTIQDVTQTAPSYVPQPPAPYEGIYASSNLPLPANRTVYVTLVDTRQPARCPALSIAQIDTTTHSVQRLPATRGVRVAAPGLTSVLPPLRRGSH
jgi:hypothetical protein